MAEAVNVNGVRDQVVRDRYALYNGDACQVMASLPAESIGLSIYSPPFGGMLYQYSSDPADLSNCKDYREFFEHYAFVVREIHRLTVPGRMTAVHCQEIAVPGDPQYLIDFPGDIIRLHEADGWRYVARYQVWKEPLLVRNRTMLKSLHHKTLTEDSTRCSIANADVLLVFRRSGKNPIPVDHPAGLTGYAGSRTPPESVLKWRGYKGHQIKNEYSQWVWRQYASSFWDDVRIDRVLPHRQAREEQDEKHVHPLQLDVIERCVVLWSNPGEVVLTPFMGVGSEVVGALMNGRKGIGVELKTSYYRQAVENVRAASADGEEQPGLALGVAEVPGDDAGPAEATEPSPDPGPFTESPVPADVTDEVLSARGLARAYGCNRCNSYRAPDFHPCPACRCPEYRIVAVPSHVGRAERPAEDKGKKRARKARAEPSPAMFDREES